MNLVIASDFVVIITVNMKANQIIDIIFNSMIKIAKYSYTHLLVSS